MKKLITYVLVTCVFLYAIVALATTVAEKDIKSNGTNAGTTTNSDVNCKLERDVRGLLWGTVTLTGKLKDGWVSVNVIKDGVTLYSGGDIKGLKYDAPIKKQVFNFEIHKDVVKESEVVIGSFKSAILTLPLKDVKITGKKRN